MSDEMYGFGVDDSEQGEPQIPNNAVAPKFYREFMDKVSGQLKDLQDQNNQLRESQRQAQVAEALTAQGIAPQAAGLFQGKPEELNDWLGTYGAALAKTDGAAVEVQGGAPQGPPQTVIGSESQAALAQMAAAGTAGASALQGDDQLAAQIAAATTEDEWNAIMRANGSKFV